MPFDLNPPLTFVATVHVTKPGQPAAPLQVRFKHKDTKQYRDFIARGDQNDREMVSEIVDSVLDKPEGMSDEQFLEILLAKFPAAATDIFLTYVRELGESRSKTDGGGGANPRRSA